MSKKKKKSNGGKYFLGKKKGFKRGKNKASL